MHKELEIANKTQSSDDKTLNLVVISMFLYLFIVALFAMTNLELTVGTLEFNALSSTFLPFYILFPLIWIALMGHSLMYYSIAASTLMFMSFLVVKSNCRTGFVSLFICISFGLLHFYTAGLKRSLKLLRSLPLLFGGFVFLVIKWQKVKQMFLDIAMTGKTRILDGSNVAEIVDLDRKLHMKSALDAVMTDIFHFIFGYGYKESSSVLSSPLFRYYKEYMPHLDFVDELGSYTNVSTFGMSGFLTDFGFAGLFF